MSLIYFFSDEILQFSGQNRVLFDAPLIQEDPLQGLSPQSKVAPLVVYNLFPSGSEEASWPLISALLAQPLPPHISFIWISSGSVTFVRPFLCAAGVNKKPFACPFQDRQVQNLERQFQNFYRTQVYLGSECLSLSYVCET